MRIGGGTGRPVTEAAPDLGINAYTLHNKVKTQHEAGSQDAGADGTSSEPERVNRVLCG
ncbi:hypothetical protein [Streptomyces sp. V4I23]|uniref:hypothetical protein n=1 Tax=Streptomyces sp. V4I23 TaxID=3042282 RepID=UPI0027D8AF58|nr:hypothetical protein [Streptomyces sp. V4I23]